MTTNTSVIPETALRSGYTPRREPRWQVGEALSGIPPDAFLRGIPGRGCALPGMTVNVVVIPESDAGAYLESLRSRFRLGGRNDGLLCPSFQKAKGFWWSFARGPAVVMDFSSKKVRVAPFEASSSQRDTDNRWVPVFALD